MQATIKTIVACISYICMGREKTVYAKRDREREREREEIKVRYDERKNLCTNHK